MALLNFSLPFGATPHTWATASPIHASPHAVNNLYEPSGHHQENVLHNNDDYYKNGPYRHHQPPQQQQQQQQSNNRNYLPPHQTTNNNIHNRNGYAPQQQQQPQQQTTRTRTYGEGSYAQQPPTGFGQPKNTFQQKPQQQPQSTKAPPTSYQTINKSNNKDFNQNQAAAFPDRPPGFKQIQSGQGTRTQNGEFFFRAAERTIHFLSVGVFSNYKSFKNSFFIFPLLPCSSISFACEPLGAWKCSFFAAAAESGQKRIEKLFFTPL